MSPVDAVFEEFLAPYHKVGAQYYRFRLPSTYGRLAHRGKGLPLV